MMRVATDLVLLHTVEDIEECLFVEFLKCLLGRLSEEYVAGLDSHVEIFLGVNHHSNLFCKTLLEDTTARILLVLLYEGIDSLLVE